MPEPVRWTHHEPLRWALFGAGGVMAAWVLMPLVVVLGVLMPLGVVSAEPEAWAAAIGSPTGRAVLAVALPLCLWHAAHRVYHGLHDLQLPRGRWVRAAVYGAAVVASVVGWGWIGSLGG